MQTIQEKIKQRRRQMLVHSYIYYELNQNIVSDHKWAKWAKELEQLQKDYPRESAEVEYAKQFKNWDGSSGAYLEFPENIKNIAHHLLRIQNTTIKPQNLQKPHKKAVQTVKKMKSSTKSLF